MYDRRAISSAVHQYSNIYSDASLSITVRLCIKISLNKLNIFWPAKQNKMWRLLSKQCLKIFTIAYNCPNYSKVSFPDLKRQMQLKHRYIKFNVKHKLYRKCTFSQLLFEIDWGCQNLHIGLKKVDSICFMFGKTESLYRHKFEWHNIDQILKVLSEIYCILYILYRYRYQIHHFITFLYTFLLFYKIKRMSRLLEPNIREVKSILGEKEIARSMAC